ncbi:MAG: ABC transporter substrate-binding protein, partial [Solirubrobacterales bacterium]
MGLRLSALASLFASLAVALLGGCGGSDSAGPATLNWFVATQPGGTIEDVAERCSKESNGRYEIEVQLLPTDASQQREQLVRRLAANDSSVDLVGMDVIWTAEFANAGWIEPWPGDLRRQVTESVFPSVIETASFEGKLYGAPFNSNTQLLWYRTDLVPEPPTTWAQMIGEAEKLGPGNGGTIQVAGANKYEGFTAWVNTMIESAGTQVLSGPEEVELQRGPTEEALAAIGRFANSSAAPTNLSTSDEDSARLGFEAGDSAFMLNYTFAYASAQAEAPDIGKKMGFARYPEVVEGQPSRPQLGGFNIGVGAFSANTDLAFEAAACVSNEESQLTAVELDGLPPSRSDLYTDKAVRKAYPGFTALVRKSIEDAAPRPQTPAYQDVSLAIQSALHPPSKIDPED